ncbi:TPA: hypothetical protein VBN90_000271 [Streptococcus agalactiae]|nr:hypothetical protein [Streptococcus agalactiae]
MITSHREQAFAISKNSERKFLFTLTNKIPSLRTLQFPDDTLFKLFFEHDGKYTIYFYVDVVKYLDSLSVDEKIIEDVLIHAATTQLFNANALIYQSKFSYFIYIRENNKILKIETENIIECRKQYLILKEFYCNYEK